MSVNPSWLGTGTNATSSGLTSGFMGYNPITGSNTTITNSNVKSTSIILISPVNTSSATNMPAIASVQNGSFNVITSFAGNGPPAGINYLICS